MVDSVDKELIKLKKDIAGTKDRIDKASTSFQQRDVRKESRNEEAATQRLQILGNKLQSLQSEAKNLADRGSGKVDILESLQSSKPLHSSIGPLASSSRPPSFQYETHSISSVIGKRARGDGEMVCAPNFSLNILPHFRTFVVQG